MSQIFGADGEIRLLTERRALRRVSDFKNLTKRKALWWIKTQLLGESLPRPVVILTTSRSGSTWLSDLMARVIGLGPVPEHLRPYHFVHAKQLNEPRAFLDAMVTAIRLEMMRGRCSGTKIIWDEIPELHDLRPTQNIVDWLEPLMADNPLWIRLHRHDRAAQAISRYRAAYSGVFHRSRSSLSFFSGALDSNNGNIPLPEYDFAAINHHYNILERAEQSLDQCFDVLPWEKYSLTYEQVTVEPDQSIPDIIQRLHAIDSPEQARGLLSKAMSTMHLKPTRDQSSDVWRQQFEADRLSQSLGSR